MRRRWLVAGAVVVVVLAVIAGVVALRSGRGRDGGPPAAVPTFDPPRRFAAEPAMNLPREADGDPPPVALDRFTAFVAVPGRLRAIDTRTGAVLADVAPQALVAAGGGAPGAPVLARRAGRDVAVAAFAVSIPGHGTTVGHDAVELVVLDRGSFTRLPGARVDLPARLGDDARLRAARVLAPPPGPGGTVATGATDVTGATGVTGVTGVTGGDAVAVVAEVGPDRVPVTWLMDLTGGGVRWRADGLAAAFAQGDLVVGVRRAQGGSLGQGGARVQAVSLATGTPVWSAGDADDAVSVVRGGPALVAVVSISPGSGTRALTFYDSRTGRAQARRPVPGGVTCRFDEQLTTVCWTADAGQPWAAGFDATTAGSRWELPDAGAGRVAPRVSTTWHGVVYGTTDAGPVVLSGPTGKDLPGASPNVAPDLVDEVVGVVGATIERPRPRVHRAVG